MLQFVGVVVVVVVVVAAVVLAVVVEAAVADALAATAAILRTEQQLVASWQVGSQPTNAQHQQL